MQYAIYSVKVLILIYDPIHVFIVYVICNKYLVGFIAKPFVSNLLNKYGGRGFKLCITR